MNFQDLQNIEKADRYLDVAFKNAMKTSDEQKDGLKKMDYLDRQKRLSMIKIQAIAKSLSSSMKHITRSFPNIDNLPEFYIELIRTQLDYPSLKKSLGALEWASERTLFFAKTYSSKIKADADIKFVNSHTKECFGRISSIMKRVSVHLEYLEESRKVMKSFPSIKTSIFTAALFGFPNVGKTTLLTKLTDAKPEINSYAFTTTKINIGYMKFGSHKIQILDTPGTLDRLNKMNPVEQQAFLAVKYCADVIICMMDLTGEYPIEKQRMLLKRIEETFSHSKKIIVYLSKMDIVKEEKLKNLEAGKIYIKNIDELKKELIQLDNSYGASAR